MVGRGLCGGLWVGGKGEGQVVCPWTYLGVFTPVHHQLRAALMTLRHLGNLVVETHIHTIDESELVIFID